MGKLVYTTPRKRLKMIPLKDTLAYEGLWSGLVTGLIFGFVIGLGIVTNQVPNFLPVVFGHDSTRIIVINTFGFAMLFAMGLFLIGSGTPYKQGKKV